MKILAKQNRELIMINPQNTQNENDAEKIILQVPEQYEDFNKKIVFVTPDGNVWDIISNNEYLIKKAITKYQQVDFYIWLTKGDVDFRSRTKTLKFYHNVDASEEITDEEIGRVNTIVNLLEEEITKVENLETEIDGKLEEIDTAIDNVNTAIQEVENLDLDAEKVGQTTTVTLTKKDGTTKVVHVDDGVDLQFMWQGTSLGIKTAEQEQYTFVDLQGIQGEKGEMGEPFTIKKTYTSVAEMNADFNNMQLGDYVMIASTVEVEDNAKLYTRGENQWIFITDFSGATGIRGETGLTPNIQIGTVAQGSSFNVTRTGTNENPILNFTLVKGDKGDVGSQGPVGATGNGIASITKTATSGLVDTYTITYTNGNTTTFTVTNGEDGEVTETELNVLRQKLENQQKVIDQLPQVEGQGTSITLENTIEASFTKFDIEGNSVQDGTPSPDNEVPIYSAGESGSINEKIINKNYLPNNVVNQTKNGVTLVKNNDGTITANGTATVQTEILISSVKLSAGNYLGSIGVTGSVSTYYVRLGEGTTSQSPFIANIGTGDNAFSLTESKTIGAVLIIRSGQTLNNVIFKPMIRLASMTDNSYVPHEEQDYSIFVQQPMRSIGDVRDCFVKKSDGWYERHYISKVVLDGTEPWSLQNDCFTFNISDIKPTPNYADRNQLITISNYYIAQTSEYRSQMLDLRVCKTIDGETPKQIAIKDTSKTLAEFKAELAQKYANGKPVYVYYLLAEPLDLPCTEEQIQQLENKPSTYKDFTIIQSEDETPAYLEVSGIYDLNKLINN